jgi:hypothetical protein
MFQQYLSSFLFGSLLKMADDVEDIPYYKKRITPIGLELLRALMYVFLTYVSVHNVNFPIVFFIGDAFLQYINEKTLDNPMFVAGMIALAVLSVLCYNSQTFDIGAILLTLAVVFPIAYMDNHFFPEDVSVRKICGRLGAVIAFLLFYSFFAKVLPVEFIMIEIGYSLTSVANMLAALDYDDLKKNTILGDFEKIWNYEMPPLDEPLKEESLRAEHIAKEKEGQ